MQYWSRITHAPLMTIAPPGTMPMWSFSEHLPLHMINISPFVINEKGIFPSGDAPPDWNLLRVAPHVYVRLIFLCVYNPLITRFPFIWIISPPLIKGITLKSYQSFFPCDNHSPWKHASMLSLQAFTFSSDKSLPLCPIYGASSCTSKTYKISI